MVTSRCRVINRLMCRLLKIKIKKNKNKKKNAPERVHSRIVLFNLPGKLYREISIKVLLQIYSAIVPIYNSVNNDTFRYFYLLQFSLPDEKANVEDLIIPARALESTIAIQKISIDVTIQRGHFFSSFA